jgi:hypothetical protein
VSKTRKRQPHQSQKKSSKNISRKKVKHGEWEGEGGEGEHDHDATVGDDAEDSRSESGRKALQHKEGCPQPVSDDAQIVMAADMEDGAPWLSTSLHVGVGAPTLTLTLRQMLDVAFIRLQNLVGLPGQPILLICSNGQITMLMCFAKDQMQILRMPNASNLS